VDRDSRVILVGHALSPYKASQPGLTWNWAWCLSHHLPVDLVAFPQYREEVEAFLAQHPNPRLRVHWVTLSGWDPWNPTRGERGIRIYYTSRLGKAYAEALRLRMAQAAWRYAQAERWDRRVERMLALYEEVLSHAHRCV
jgi:hypothetical protein